MGQKNKIYDHLCMEYVLNEARDVSSKGFVVVDFNHASIHKGESFLVKNYTTLANGASIDFAVVTPNSDVWAHMSFLITGTQGTKVDIYEASDFDADGSAVTPINTNRNSSNTSVLTITSDPSVNSDGNLIWSGYNGALKTSSEHESIAELILKQNTKYIYRITNLTIQDNIVDYVGYWHEIADRLDTE
jgi:hypothetical protein